MTITTKPRCLPRARRDSDAVVLHLGSQTREEIKHAALNGIELTAYCGAKRVPIIIPPRPLHAIDCPECLAISGRQP